jgi:AP2 domain
VADLKEQADMMTVPLHGKLGTGQVALVDEEDYDLVVAYRWYARRGNRGGGIYAMAPIWSDRRRSWIRMHNLIMGCKGIDHRNHNGLDNQRSNLRVATGSQNNANQRPQQGRASRFKGVSRRRQRWRATIQVRGLAWSLGGFATEEEAARAYDAAALHAWGEFAYLNFPLPEPGGTEWP